MDTPNDLIPIRAAAQLHPSRKPGRRLHVSTLYRWLALGRLRSWLLGSARLVSRREVLGLLRPGREPKTLPARACERESEEAGARERLRGLGYRV